MMLFDDAARQRREAAAAATPSRERALREPAAIPVVLVGVGAALVVVALFLPWWTASREAIQIPGISTGWEWLGVLDVYLFVSALVAAAVAWQPEQVWLPTVAAGMAAVGMLAIFARLINPPDGGNRFILEFQAKIGPFAAILGLALILLATARRVRVPAP